MSCGPADLEMKQLIDRWIAQWNEPSPDERHRLIRDVWTERRATRSWSTRRKASARPPRTTGFPSRPSRSAAMYAIYARVTRAVPRCSSPTESTVFEQQGEVVRHAGGTPSALNWVMRSRASRSACRLAAGWREVPWRGPARRPAESAPTGSIGGRTQRMRSPASGSAARTRRREDVLTDMQREQVTGRDVPGALLTGSRRGG